MVRLVRMIVRLLFKAAAVAALVWVARELMRRWVEGPDRPAVEGNWQRWEPPAGRGSPGTTGQAATRLDGAAPAPGPNTVSEPTGAPSAPPAPEMRPADRPGSAGTNAAGTRKAPSQKAPAQKAPSRRAGAAPGGSWVAPNGSGEPPATHPVKAKTSSRVYRVPGMAMYDRTIPDRCYTTPEAAEADGFTRAKR